MIRMEVKAALLLTYMFYQSKLTHSLVKKSKTLQMGWQWQNTVKIVQVLTSITIF